MNCKLVYDAFDTIKLLKQMQSQRHSVHSLHFSIIFSMSLSVRCHISIWSLVLFTSCHSYCHQSISIFIFSIMASFSVECVHNIVTLIMKRYFLNLLHPSINKELFLPSIHRMCENIKYC